jgi:hypothetical protein
MSTWQPEVCGASLTVIRRRLPIAQPQDIARDENGRIIWFTSRDEAQTHADELNKQDKVMPCDFK